MIDTSNFMLGRYIGLAVNNPKKYPKHPLSQDSDLEEDQNDGNQMTAEDEAKINAMMGAFAKKANKLPEMTAATETEEAKESEDAGNK